MNSENTRRNPIGHELWLILRWLKLLGNSPIEPPFSGISNQETKNMFKNNQINHPCNNFEYRTYTRVSIGAIFNIILNGFFLFFSVSFILESLFQLHVLTLRYNYSLKFVSSKESNSSSYSDSQIKLVSIAAKVLSSGFLQSFQIYEIWFAWTTAGELVNFLNCWAFFAKQFDQCFREINITVQSAFIPNLRKVRRKLFIFLGVIPVFTLLPFYLIVNQASQRLTYISLVSVGLQLIPRRFLEEGKIYMMFAILQESYAQIGYGITTWAQRGAKIDAAVVQFWKRLIIFIRAQCNLVSKIHSGLELVLSFYSMVGVTVLVFILINYTALESNGRNLGFLSLSACFTIALLLRLYAKCSMAEEITVQEQKVSNLLCNLSAERDSCDVPLQLQFQQIYSLLQQSPITINMGSYGTLNKRLVLTVFGQVVTYLIVLLQLNSSMRNIEN